jgi:hypothetical protein
LMSQLIMGKWGVEVTMYGCAGEGASDGAAQWR